MCTMSDEGAERDEISPQSKQANKPREGTPRKSKAKELVLLEEFCVFCFGSPSSTDEDFEELLRCSECHKYAHPSCLEMPLEAIENTKLYDWQCNDCKGCYSCKKKTKEKYMILCDYCDRGFHTFCLDKKLTQARRVSWRCPFCVDAKTETSDVHIGDTDNESPIKDNQEGSTKTDLDKIDDKIITDEGIIQSNKVSKQKSALGKMSESDSTAIGDISADEEAIVKGVVKGEKLKYCEGHEEISNTKVDEECNNKEMLSREEESVGKHLEKERVCSENQKGSIEPEVAKDEVLDVEKGKSKKGRVKGKLPHRSSPRRSSSTLHFLPEKKRQREDKRLIEDVAVGKKNKNLDSVAKPETIVQRRRSSRLSHGGIDEWMVQFEKIKEEKGSRTKAECEENVDKNAEAKETVREKDAGKMMRRRSRKIVEEGTGEEKTSENVPLISLKRAADNPLNEEVISNVRKRDKNENANEDDGSMKVESEAEESKILSRQNGEGIGAGLETVVLKRKRGRPKKASLEREKPVTPQKDKESVQSDSAENNQEGTLSPEKTQVLLSKKESKKTPIEDSKKDCEEMDTDKDEIENRRVLRKTSREPGISPAKAKLILSSQTIERVYPIRTEQEKCQAMTRASDLSQTRTPTKRVLKTPSKTSGQKSNQKVTPKAATPLALPSKDGRKSSNKKSDGKKPGSKSSEKRKEGKAKINDRKVSNESLSKRKLAFEEKPKNKKVRLSREEKSENDGNQRSRRRSMAAKKEEERMEVKADDLANFVSLEDLALFEEAQKLFKADMNKDLLSSMDQGIRKVHFGEFEIDTWYSSPYPSEYKLLGKVFVCEYCLKYMKSATILRRHMAKCTWRHPPGDEIYRKDNISVFEVDGEKSSTYCQNLCLFAKLFLDHKTLYYEVEPFLFYVMTVADCSGCHIVGYFSKEKVSFLNYNVSCILVLPHCMRKGYGKILIDFSYLLSRVEGKIGSPERPLSDLGLISYRSYWKDVLLRYLTALEDERVSIKEMSQKTSVMSNDLISTMQYLGILKYWKGKHVITVQQEMLDAYTAKTKSNRKFNVNVEETYLEWTPKDYGNGKSRSKNS